MSSSTAAESSSHLLVTPAWLQARLGDPSLRVIDVRPAESFAKGHIVGAANIDLYGMTWHDTSPAGLRDFQQTMEAALCGAGVTHEQTVVFYQGNSGMVAGRGFWMLEYFGHAAPRILDGGLKAWSAAGFGLTSVDDAPAPTTFKTRLTPARLATYEYVRTHLHDPDVVLFDVRAPEEYYGEHVRAARGGAIPGALNCEWTQALAEDGRFKGAAELRQLYAGLGVSPAKEIIPYCQGGFRSSHAYVALRLLGYGRLRNYIGSWKEWGDRLELPIETPRRPS